VSFGPSRILLDAEASARAPEVDFGDISTVSPDLLLWRRFRSSRAAKISAAAIIVLLVIAILAPLVVDIIGVTGPNVRNASTLNSFGLPTGPSFAHPFGVDDMGRDVLARVIYGARIALLVGICGTLIATVAGAAIGLVAGVYGGWIETVLMGAVDLFLAFPMVLLGLGIGDACRVSGCGGGVIEPGTGTVIFIVVLCSFPYVARSVRRRVVSLRDEEFVFAARSLGASTSRILYRELLPNLMAPLIVYAVVLIPTNILLEAALSFLGVGISSPTADWGQMISGAGNDILSGNAAWWYLVFPGLALLLTVLAFNLVGDVLLEALRSPTTSDP